MFYLLHFRCSSTQTVPPCGGSICCSLRATSATSLCQRSTLPTGSVLAPSVLCVMAAWSLTRPCLELRRICWVTQILLTFTHPVVPLLEDWWSDNSYIFSYPAQFLSQPSCITCFCHICLDTKMFLYVCSMFIESFCCLLGVFSFCPDIFTQQCHFLRQSGHTEKAISLFQAMIDFTFFKPGNVRELSTKQQVNTHTQ